MATLSRHRDELAEFFRVPTPAWDVVRWAWDKRNTYRLAEELGIPRRERGIRAISRNYARSMRSRRS